MATVGKATTKKSSKSHSNPTGTDSSSSAKGNKADGRDADLKRGGASKAEVLPKKQGKSASSQDNRPATRGDKSAEHKSTQNSASALLTLTSPVSISTAASSGASFGPNFGAEVSKVADGAGKWGAGVTQSLMDMFGVKGESTQTRSATLGGKLDDQIESNGEPKDEVDAETVLDVSNAGEKTENEKLDLRIQSKNTKSDTGKISFGHNDYGTQYVDVVTTTQDEHGLAQNGSEGEKLTGRHSALDPILGALTIDTDGVLKADLNASSLRKLIEPKTSTDLNSLSIKQLFESKNSIGNLGVISKIPNLSERNRQMESSKGDRPGEHDDTRSQRKSASSSRFYEDTLFLGGGYIGDF